jgi:outer membrane lipoprotein-sorting protein
MMDCETFCQHIDAYADGALAPHERVAFEAHRATCADCQTATTQARRLDDLLRTALPALAAATPVEQATLRESVLGQLDVPAPGDVAAGWRRYLSAWTLRLAGMGAVLALALLAILTLLPGDEGAVSAAEIVGRAWASVEGRQGMSGVLHWEAEWSQRFPSGEQIITRTFEIYFDFDHPGRYRISQRDPSGLVFNEMVRDGADRMWQLSRTVSQDGHERVQVDEIILSSEEMRELASWYVPSPFLDDLDRFAEVLDNVELVREIEVAGRPAYVLRGQLFGFGWPVQGSRIDPVTSTVQLVVDAETYWLLGRAERVPLTGGQGAIAAGLTQRTRRFEILSPEQVPPEAFSLVPPPGAEVRTVEGIAGYYAPASDAIGLDEAAALTSFSLVLPSKLPHDLKARPSFRHTCPSGQCQGPGRAGIFGIVYLGQPGRQAFLLEYEQARLPGRAARLVAVGDQQGWLAPDPIDGRKFSLYLVEPEPDVGPDGRPWPRTVELQVWGLSLDEAVGMLASLEPY